MSITSVGMEEAKDVMSGGLILARTFTSVLLAGVEQIGVS